MALRTFLPLAIFLAPVLACSSEAAEDSEEVVDDLAEEALTSTCPKSLRCTPKVSYSAQKDSVHNLAVYAPATASTKPRPLVVWVHGGAFAAGTRRDPHLVRLAEHSASLGYVSVSVDYTLLTKAVDKEHPFPYPRPAINAAREDVRMAIAFMRAHAGDYGIDPGRIAIGGSSAGSITALDVAYNSSPADRDKGIRAVVDLWGALETKPLLQKGDAPILILHGTADNHWMPYAQALLLRDSARAAGVPYKFYPLPGKNHGPWEGLDSYLDDITPFLKQHL